MSDPGGGASVARRWQGLRRSLGPGILFAGAAIGGSHLVQSTRAGADFGFALVWIVVLVLICKYPFFEFSHRYVALTGRSLLEGYSRLGRPALVVFFVIAVVASFINVAAVTLVTGGLAGNLLSLDLPIWQLSGLVLVVVVAILVYGRYRAMDLLMKIMVCVLALFTLVAVSVAFAHGPAGDPTHVRPEIWTLGGLSFLLALMGWMPAPVDVAVWPSLWARERIRLTGHRPSLGESLFDFHVGYLGTSLLALAFIAFGALVMYGTGTVFSNSGLRFSGQLVEMYTATLGAWSGWLISMVAFITMFSTTLTVLDGYARTLQCSIDLLWPGEAGERTWLYTALLAVLAILGLAIIGWLMSGIKTLIDVATILAFLTAPVVAFLNYRVVTSEDMPSSGRPGPALRGLSWLGFVYLGGFGLVYVGWRVYQLLMKG